MKLKLDADGHVVVVDGKPVYTHDDGKDIPFDAPSTVAKISQLNGEAKTHRERAEKAESGLKVFDGIDSAEAKKAIETLKNIDSKKLVDAGDMERIKAEMTKSMQAEYQPKIDRLAQVEQQLVSEKIGGSFARSKLIAEKLAIPPDLVEAAFGKHFSIDENGKVIAKDSSGKELFSRTNHGERADFDEALEMLVDSYPHKDSILKGSGMSGGGAPSGGGGSSSKSINRAQFDSMQPSEKAAHVKAGGTVVD